MDEWWPTTICEGLRTHVGIMVQKIPQKYCFLYNHDTCDIFCCGEMKRSKNAAKNRVGNQRFRNLVPVTISEIAKKKPGKPQNKTAQAAGIIQRARTPKDFEWILN